MVRYGVNEKLEKYLVKEILDYLNGLDCCRAIKVHGGMYGNTGEPDIDCVYKGRSIKIEVKRKGNKPTKIQESIMRKWKEAGCLAFWTDDIDIVIQEIIKLEEKIHSKNPLYI